MIILKGDCGKSRVVENLMNTTNSICFMYDDFPSTFSTISLDCREYSLNDFLECISNALEKAAINDEHYDYLLIYTNQDEGSLQSIINWLKLSEYKDNIPCRDIILACK